MSSRLTWWFPLNIAPPSGSVRPSVIPETVGFPGTSSAPYRSSLELVVCIGCPLNLAVLKPLHPWSPVARILTASKKREGKCYEWLCWINCQSAGLSYEHNPRNPTWRSWMDISPSFQNPTSQLKFKALLQKFLNCRHTATVFDFLGHRHWYHKV